MVATRTLSERVAVLETLRIEDAKNVDEAWDAIDSLRHWIVGAFSAVTVAAVGSAVTVLLSTGHGA